MRMYDSVTPEQIPQDAAIVAGYIDGHYAWSTAQWGMFPNARHVRIAVLASTNDGDVIDCEIGDATPQQAAEWAIMRYNSGLSMPGIYCNRSTWSSVIAAVASRVPISYWIAEWTGQAHSIVGADSVQYADPRFPITGGRNVDVSEVYNGPWLPNAVPNPPNPPSNVAPPFPGQILRYPPVVNSGEVRQWQQQMWHRGWNITVDGSYGPASANVCRQFQAEKGLITDGIVGPNTWAAAWNTPGSLNR